MSTGPNNTKFLPEALRSIAASTFTGSYQAVGTALAHPLRAVCFVNNTSKDITASWDGTNDHMFIPAGSFRLLDVSSNKELSQICEIANQTTFYVKAAAGTGSFYIETYYAA